MNLLKFWKNRYKKSITSGHYDTVFNWSDKDYRLETKQLLIILKIIYKLRGRIFRSVLDFGCGKGRFSKFFSNTYYGCDILTNLIKYNEQKNKCKKRHFFLIENNKALPISVDLIFCSLVLQHLPDKEYFFRLKNFYKKGQELIIIESIGSKKKHVFHRDNLKNCLKVGYKLWNDFDFSLRENYKILWLTR